jgi:hypothetical protein
LGNCCLSPRFLPRLIGVDQEGRIFIAVAGAQTRDGGSCKVLVWAPPSGGDRIAQQLHPGGVDSLCCGLEHVLTIPTSEGWNGLKFPILAPDGRLAFAIFEHANGSCAALL